MAAGENPSDSTLAAIISSSSYDAILSEKANLIRRAIYGNQIFLRGLIEITSYCKNNCYYCGLRAGNANTMRYRMSENEILHACNYGYSLGLRTFVLQGGEDPAYTDKAICSIIENIKKRHPDCAITLSLGEKEYNSYKSFYDAGADRYLLRHETADAEHYRFMHPENMSLEKRKECLFALKEIGFQVGSGLMVGAPKQTVDNIISDLRFLQQLSPDMIGIGPFMRHSSTPFASYENGSGELTVRLLALLRILFSHALLPSTTALFTLDGNWMPKALKSGANVIMPNLTPLKYRKKYELYDGKASLSLDSADNLKILVKKLESLGFVYAQTRGDVKR